VFLPSLACQLFLSKAVNKTLWLIRQLIMVNKTVNKTLWLIRQLIMVNKTVNKTLCLKPVLLAQPAFGWLGLLSGLVEALFNFPVYRKARARIPVNRNSG
jgi:hypothetical protein